LNSASAEGADTELVELYDKRIEPCNACLKCGEEKRCIIKDDFQYIFDKMVSADGIIIGTPVYVGSVTSKVKSLIDRATYLNLQFPSRERPLRDKVAGPIVVARKVGHVYAYLQIVFFFLITGMIVTGFAFASAMDEGEVLKDQEGLTLARGLGRRVARLCKKLKS
jgi:multimeric flavodoxin WrbA